MSKIIAVDLGNTCIKAGIFDGSTLVESYRWDNDQHQLEQVLSSQQLSHSIVSSVVESDQEIKELLRNHTQCMVLNQHTPLPFLNAYLSSDSLGMDRVALAAAAFEQYPHNNNLIISVGTAITYNVVMSNRAFRGGNITPGIQMRLQALHHFTDKLPLVNSKGDTTLLGYDTESSIRSGVINGVAFEIDGFIDAYRAQFKEINVFLTGGDVSILGSKIKNTTFVDPNLQLKGLNSILRYNVTK